MLLNLGHQVETPYLRWSFCCFASHVTFSNIPENWKMMIEDFRTCSLKWRRNYGKKPSSPENKEIQWKTASQLSISKCVLVACYFSFRKKNTSFSLNHNKKSATTKPKSFPKFSQQKQLPISPKHLHLPLKNSSGNTHPIRPNHHNHHNRIFGNETNQPPGGKQNRSYGVQRRCLFGVLAFSGNRGGNAADEEMVTNLDAILHLAAGVVPAVGPLIAIGKLETKRGKNVYDIYICSYGCFWVLSKMELEPNQNDVYDLNNM